MSVFPPFFLISVQLIDLLIDLSFESYKEIWKPKALGVKSVFFQKNYWHNR